MSTYCSAEWEQRFVQIVDEGGHEAFFHRVLLASGIKHLLIISPWITSLKDEEVQLQEIIRKIKKGNINTRVFMRHPKKEHFNIEAANMFISCPTATLFFNNELHAKVYVCRCDPFGFALVGSANLSGKATRAYEIGLMIQGKGRGVEIIEDLEKLGSHDLPGRAGTQQVTDEAFREGGVPWKLKKWI